MTLANPKQRWCLAQAAYPCSGELTHHGSGARIYSGYGIPLRTCFAELKAEVLLYALGHEKDLRYRPFGRRMG